MESENEAVLSAYRLWKMDLLTNETFYEMLVKIRGNTPSINPSLITQSQKNYILKLQNEGKIPKSQSLNISKSEAQILIKETIERDNQTPKEAIKDVFNGITNRVDDELKSLFEGGDNY